MVRFQFATPHGGVEEKKGRAYKLTSAGSRFARSWAVGMEARISSAFCWSLDASVGSWDEPDTESR